MSKNSTIEWNDSQFWRYRNMFNHLVSDLAYKTIHGSKKDIKTILTKMEKCLDQCMKYLPGGSGNFSHLIEQENNWEEIQREHGLV